MKETKSKTTQPAKHVITFNGFTFFDERLISLREAASLLDLSLTTLYSRMESGKIQLSHVRLTEFLHRLKLTEVAALLDESEQIKIYNTKLNQLPDLLDIPTACKFLHISQAQFYRMMNPANPDKFTFPVNYTSTKRKVLKEDLYNYIDLKTFSR